MSNRTKPEIPTSLSDFDQSTPINHPGLPNDQLFVVKDPKYGKGIWSTTLNKPILPIEIANIPFSFEAVIPSLSTIKIFWEAKVNNNTDKILYMADSDKECAVKVKIPSQHKFNRVLSENILLIICCQVTNPNKHKLYNLHTRGLISLQVKPNGVLGNVYILENENQIMLLFHPLISTGVFIIDTKKFSVKHVLPSK